MKQLTLLLLLRYCSAGFFDIYQCVIDYRSLENMWDQKLLHDLKDCGYNPYEPPPYNATDPLDIQVDFIIRKFKYDSELQEFTTFMWIFIEWADERLKWNPENYDGVDKVVSIRSRIWAPSIRLINGIGDEWDQRYMDIPCTLSSYGGIKCVARTNYKVKCGQDLTDWPYDVQTCKLIFGPYSVIGTKFELYYGLREVSISKGGSEWDIINYEKTVNKTTEKQLILKYKLKRHAEVLNIIVIFPSLILTVLTFLSLFVDVRLNLRLLVICFSLMCYFYLLTDLKWKIPEDSKDPPRFLIYYRGTFIMTFIHAALSLTLNNICRNKDVCPDCINRLNNFVFIDFTKFNIRSRWESNDKIKESETNIRDWTNFANIINYFWIFVSAIVYISLYWIFVPHPIRYKFP